jgi:hypothetical protein
LDLNSSKEEGRGGKEREREEKRGEERRLGPESSL